MCRESLEKGRNNWAAAGDPATKNPAATTPMQSQVLLASLKRTMLPSRNCRGVLAEYTMSAPLTHNQWEHVPFLEQNRAECHALETD